MSTYVSVQKTEYFLKRFLGFIISCILVFLIQEETSVRFTRQGKVIYSIFGKRDLRRSHLEQRLLLSSLVQNKYKLRDRGSNHGSYTTSELVANEFLNPGEK